MDPDSSLTDLFKNALAGASKALNLPTIEDNTQVKFPMFIIVFVQCALRRSFETYRTY